MSGNTQVLRRRGVSRRHGVFLYGDLTDRIIELAIKVHKKLGPGFLERIYEKALSYELSRTGIRHVRQKPMLVKHDEVSLGDQRVDMLVENKIIVELRAVSELTGIHRAQMISYLRTTGKKVGLILNFANLKLEIKRIIN